MVQNDKKFSLLLSISQEPYIIWLSFMVPMCKIIISPGVFFNFEILVFRVVRGLKGQKMAQNDKKFCLSYSVSQELYIIWLWFFWYACVKWLYLQQIFFIFQNFVFGVAQYLRNCRSYHQDFDNDLYRCFSFFLKKKKQQHGKY